MNFETSCFPMPNNKNSIFKCSANKYFIINLQNIGNKYWTSNVQYSEEKYHVRQKSLEILDCFFSFVLFSLSVNFFSLLRTCFLNFSFSFSETCLNSGLPFQLLFLF